MIDTAASHIGFRCIRLEQCWENAMTDQAISDLQKDGQPETDISAVNRRDLLVAAGVAVRRPRPVIGVAQSSAAAGEAQTTPVAVAPKNQAAQRLHHSVLYAAQRCRFRLYVGTNSGKPSVSAHLHHVTCVPNRALDPVLKPFSSTSFPKIESYQAARSSL